MTLFDLVAKLTLDSSQYEEGLNGARGKLNAFAKGLDGGINKILKVGAAAAGAAITGVTAFARAAVQTGMQFDTAMSQVAATMGATVDEIQELRDFAQQMGATTKFTASQAAEGLNYMALAGYDAEKSMAMLPTVLNLASAGAMDLGRASDMVTDAESALGLTTEETAVMIDQMAKAASKSNTSVEQLGDAILTIGGTASFMAGGTDRLATVLGILADNGIKGSEAGTKLRNMLLRLSSPTEDGAAMMEQLGLQIYDASGSMRDMQDIILDFNAAMDGMTDQEKINIISELFNERDVAAVNALLHTSKERWDELGSAILDSKGAADAMADTQLDNLNGDITIMKSALDGVKIAFSDGITPAIRDVVQRVTKALSNPKTSKFLKETGQKLGELTKQIAHGVSNAIPKLIKLFTEGADKIPLFAAAIAGVTLAVKATVNPIGALVSGLALLAGGLAIAELAADDAAHKFSSLTEAQWAELDAASAAADAMDEARDARQDAASSIDAETDKLRSEWEQLQALVNKNGDLTEAEQKRGQYLLGELNAALGTEYEWNNLINGQYQDMAANIENLIQKRQAERYLESAEETAQASRERLPEIQAGITDAQQLIDELDGKIWELRGKEHELIRKGISPEDVGMGAKLLRDTQTQIDEYLAAIHDAEEQIKAYRDEEVNAYADMTLAEQAFVAVAEGDYARVAELMQNDVANRQQHKIEAGQISDEFLQDVKHSADVATESYQRYLDDTAAGLVEHNEETERALAEAAATAQHNYTVAKIEAEKNAREIYDEFIEALGEGESLAEEEGGNIANAAAGAMDASTEASSAGENLTLGFARGIEKPSAIAAATAAAGRVAAAAAANLKVTLQEKSPSKLTQQFGKFFTQGFAKGILDPVDDVLNAAEDVADTALDAFDGGVDDGYLMDTYAEKTEDGNGGGAWSQVCALLGEIRDRIGGDVVLDSGELVGYLDGAFGDLSMRKARAGA